MEKRKTTSLSLKNKRSKSTPSRIKTPDQKGSSDSILQDAALNRMSQSGSPLLAANGSYLETLAKSAEKCANDNLDIHCSFETDSGSAHNINIPMPQDRILADVVAYIEARSNNENQFEGISQQMEILGARVFKDGKKATRERALKKGIHLVSVLWVESCRQNGEHVSEDMFPVVVPEDTGTPLVLGKAKRIKSMQPKAFEDDVKNSAERGQRRRRRRILAENPPPSALIFCEETQAPYSPLSVKLSPTTPHVVPDTPCHGSSAAFTFNEKLVYEGDSSEEISRSQEQIETDQSQGSKEDPPVKIPHLKRRLLTNRTSGRSDSSSTDQTKTPTTPAQKTPTDVLLTGSEHGKKRKRTQSNVSDGKDVPPNDKKKVRLGGEVVSEDGHSLPRTEGNLSTHSSKESGTSLIKKGKSHGNLQVEKQVRNVVETKDTKASGIVKQRGKNLVSVEENDGNGSDSGVSVTDENSKLSFAYQGPSVSKKKKIFSKTEKLVRQITIADKGGVTSQEAHENKGGNTVKTKTGSVAMKQNLKPDKPVGQVKEPGSDDKRIICRDGRDDDSRRNESKVNQRKGKFSEAKRLASQQEKSEEDEEEEREDTCTEDEEQQNVNNERTNSKNARGKLVKRVKPKRSIVMTSMHFGEQDIVVSVVRKLGGFFIEDRVSTATSHVIAGCPRRTLNVLMAIAHGCWLVSPAWIMKSLEVGYWVDEEPYELSEAFPAAQLCRLERVSAGPGFQQELFSECASIFVSETCSPPSDALMTLVNLCGGKVSSSVRKAGICIGTMTRRTQAINISEQWLLDCITQHRVLPFTNYALNSPAKRGRETSPSY